MNGIVGFVLGFALALLGSYFVIRNFFKKINRELLSGKIESDEIIAGHCFRYLEVLCRELANHMMKRDPDYFLKTYKRWREEYDRIGELSETEMKDRLRVISSEIPVYEEFDLIGVRDFIDVNRYLMDLDIEQIGEHYRKIKSWIALLSRTNDEWRHASGWRFGNEMRSGSIDEYEVLKGELRTQRYENLKAEFNRAMDLYWKRRNDDSVWDGDEYSVCRVPRILPSNFYGIELKRFGKYGVVEIYRFDDGHVLKSYYESDACFSEDSLTPIL